ncbi:MAG TPA: DEAD/DEAH box helicase [candidate division Zixibacteria bacterium]|nr:DEAD/DEAH box helicase [candidate division Zixibacteria bacterium]
MDKQNFIEHKYIKPESIEARLYQQTIFASSLKSNTLVVLPTGLGKTIILALLTARRMEQYPQSFILILAPTKPLVEQHLKTFRNVINVIEDEIVMLSGDILPEKRRKLWKQGQIIIATPQVVENDLLAGRLNLQNCSLLGVDEAHRAVGDYAYVYVAKQYLKTSSRPLIFAITASPGSDQSKIQHVCDNLSIKNIETRMESSHDVKQYVQKTDVEWVHVELPKKFQRIKILLDKSLSFKLKELKRLGWIESSSVNINRRDLLKLPPLITKQFDQTENPTELYTALGLVGSSIRLTHALELLETQGITSLIKYFEKMHKEGKSSKGTRTLLSLLSEDALVISFDIAKQLQNEGIEHPKIPELEKYVGDSIENSPDSKILVFTQYRNSAKLLADILNKISNIRASRFVGQTSKSGDKGFSQKEQLKIMQQFRDGELNCLVATSVGEEGLDVSECDLVVFYDCVPSAIRNIQRRGRTGRKREGRVIVLITKGTRDEGYFWASRHKERQMKQNLRELEKYNKKSIDLQQRTMEDFFAAASEQDTNIEEDAVFEGDDDFEEFSILSDEALSKIEEEIEGKSEPAFVPSSQETNVIKSFTKIEESDALQNQAIKIVVDTRESKSGIAKELVDLDVEVELQQLNVADYILSSRVGVERKDVTDFSQSIIDGRLFPQLISLKRNYPIPILILEGETLYGQRALNPEAIRGAIASITINLDIKVIWTRSTKDTARFLRVIAKREQQKSDNKPTIRTEKAPVDSAELQEFIVAGFPNINAVLAKRILKRFGSLENFFNASVEDLQNIKGIGKKIALEIKELIEKEYIT